MSMNTTTGDATVPHARVPRPRCREASAHATASARAAADHGHAHVHDKAPHKGAVSLDPKRLRSELPDLASRFRVQLAVAAVLIVASVSLYGPACELYQQWRISGKKDAQLTTLNEENAEKQEDISRLQTREGIEEEARKRGYVAEGETSVTVVGMEDQPVEEELVEGDPWYLGITDLIFQYGGEE